MIWCGYDERGVVTTALADLRAWGVLAYVGNDPVNATDPDGQESNPLYGMNSRGQPNAAARGCAGCGAKVAGGVADFTPVVGDIKGAVEFAQNPTPLGAVGVVVGVVPIVGDLGKAALKQTDEVVQLNKQLASEAQMSQLLDGGGTVFAGGDSGVVFRDAEKIAESLGDNVNASDLVKVKSDPHVTPDGMSLSTHAVRNEKTGEILEPKSIINERANRWFLTDKRPNLISQSRDLSELLGLLSEDGYRDLDLIERSRRIVTIWVAHDLDDNQPDYLKVLSIDSQTDHVPKGSVRENWNAKALARADAESAECEESFREVFESARQGMLDYLSSIMRKN